VKDAADAIIKPEQAAYLEGIEPPRDALLREMEEYARAHREPISDPEVASFLAVTARAAQPKRIVELGTNIGYGAIVLARAAAAAKVITIEKNPSMVKTARGFVEKAGLADRIEVREGDALAEIRGWKDPIDLLYVDCVKEDYVGYLEAALPRLSERGVVIADNVLWKGLVAAKDVPANEKARVEALRAFNRVLTTTPGIRGVVLPLGDGVGYAVRVG
jgi:predicted O-methyltransferase YrrM